VADANERSRLPEYLELPRHRDYAGRRGVRVFRLATTAVFAAFVLLGVLNVFGQQPSTSVVAGRVATMRVSTPSRLRLGLVFQTRVDISAAVRIASPTLTLSPAWFDGVTLNSVYPSPASQTGRSGGVSFAFPPLAAGHELTVWLEWSVNPTNVAWRRPELLQLSDGSRRLLDVHRSVTVFP
jgi:hypothetical protein